MAKYKIDGNPVSKPWHTVLTHYRRTGGQFRVNSGRRTLKEQWRLYRLYKAGKGNLAAYPNPGAPHIRYGRANHAIDVDNLAHATNRTTAPERMLRWLTSNGVQASRPVPGEPWHIEVDRAGLLRFAKSIERKRARR